MEQLKEQEIERRLRIKKEREFKELEKENKEKCEKESEDTENINEGTQSKKVKDY